MLFQVGALEECAEAAGCHALANVVCVLGLVEEVGVGVEGDAGAGVAEDAADLGDVEFEVDDEVACEGVSEVVDAEAWLVGGVELGVVGGASEAAAFDVSIAEWCAGGGREDVVAVG